MKMNYVLNRRRVFEGKVVRVDEVKLDFGAKKQPTYELITFNTVTGVSALAVEKKHIFLIKHYQLGRNQVGYSIPTGGLNLGEDPYKRMNLELQEELGMKAEKLTLMLRPDILPSYIGTEAGYLFLAEKLTPKRLVGDEDYKIEVERMSLNDALTKVKQGIITDSRTILALLTYKEWYG